MRSVSRPLLGLAVAVLLAAPLTGTTSALAASDVKLPAPYVSRALDAVLMPIDDSVRSTFGLANADNGVLVIAVEPGGVADGNGILAGDVLFEIHGHKVASPIDVDEIVRYWINKNEFGFLIDYYRDGTIHNANANITLELYSVALDIATVASWNSVSSESFSYEEYYSETSTEMTESYESSETTIEETTTTEEYSSEVATEEESATEDTDADGIVDTEDTDDDNDGIDDADDSDDNGDGVDDASDDEGGGDD